MAVVLTLAVGCASQKSRNAAWQESLTPQAESFSTSGRNRYFILEPGYQLVLEGKEGVKTVQLAVTVLDETKRVGDVETRVVEERETAGGKLVEVSRNYLAFGVRSRNVYYFGEDVDEYKGEQVSHGGAWQAGAAGATFGILMPGEIQIGDKYYQEKAPGAAMDRAENVSVTEALSTPAGNFVHCLKVRETTPLEAGTEYKFYAPDIGLIQDGSLRLVRYGFVKK
jgi:hypothetical protein